MYFFNYAIFFCFFLSGSIQPLKISQRNRNIWYVFCAIVGGAAGYYIPKFLKKNDFIKRIKNNKYEKEFIFFDSNVYQKNYEATKKKSKEEDDFTGFFFVKYDDEEKKWLRRRFYYKNFHYEENQWIRMSLTIKLLSQEEGNKKKNLPKEEKDPNVVILSNGKQYWELALYGTPMNDYYHYLYGTLYYSEENEEEEIAEEIIENSFYEGLVFSLRASRSERPILYQKPNSEKVEAIFLRCNECQVYQEVPTLDSRCYKVVQSFFPIRYGNRLQVCLYDRFFYLDPYENGGYEGVRFLGGYGGGRSDDDGRGDKIDPKDWNEIEQRQDRSEKNTYLKTHSSGGQMYVGGR